MFIFLGYYSLMGMAKYWKIIKTSGHIATINLSKIFREAKLQGGKPTDAVLHKNVLL